MRVLLTGISGFIGCHLARELESAGAEVFGLADAPGAYTGELFRTDILDLPALSGVVETCTPDVVVHLAGLSHVGESWKRPGDYLRVNFVGTRNVLRAAAGSRVIIASSAEVYGVVPEAEQPIREDRPLDPRSPYAMTKACAEIHALEQGAIVVRAFNVVGVGQSRHFAVPSFAAQLAAIRAGEREPVLKVGDLSPRRDFLHVADAASAYRALIENGEPGRVYNVASGEAFSIRQVVDRLRAVSGVTASVERDEARVRPVDIPLLRGDNRRLRGLGWAPEYDLDRALTEIWRAISERSAARRGPGAAARGRA